jgi:tetratricopeptide (TPR) repeat protein
MTDGTPLRVFVAMPVETMGKDAIWDDVKEIRQKLLSPAVAEIGVRLDRAVKLFIEDAKKRSGDILSSMFAEATDADVYIADLTGFSANVFLELGVRWAVKDRVTILITQDKRNLKFNVAFNRAIEYGPTPTKLETAISDIAEYAISGLADENDCDSPVRRGSRLLTVPRLELESLKSELARLKSQQGEDLLQLAQATDDQGQKIELLRRAASINPANFNAHLLLGRLLREVGEYAESEQELQAAVRIVPKSAEAWRELGTTQSKAQRLREASYSLSMSLDLDHDQAETWRVLGGLRRRLSRAPDGSIEDWQGLINSRNAYEHASELEPNNSYSLVNFWLLSLILAIHEGGPTEPIIEQFEALRLLCQYEVKRNPSDPWKRLDLSTTYVVLEDEQEAVSEVDEALRAAGQRKQVSYIESAIPPLRDLVQVLETESPRLRAATAIIQRMEAAVNSATS